MAEKAKQLLYPVGIESLFIVFWKEKEDQRDELPEYESEIYRMDNIVTIGIAGDPQEMVKWASNKIFVNASRNTKYDLNLTHVALPQEVQDKMDGVKPIKGISFETSKVKEFPFFAMGFIAPLSDGSKVARWYPKVQKTLSDEEFETIEEEAEVKDIENVFKATPLLKNEVTEVKFSEVREGADGITAEDFMEQVVADESEIAELFPDNGDSGNDGDSGDDGNEEEEEDGEEDEE